MKVSIVIPAYNQAQHTITALKGVVKTCGVDFETILIDDGSTEPIYKVLPKLYTDVKVLRNEVNSGFIKSVNRGIQAATGDLVLLLNNDVEINNAGWLAKLIKGMEAGGFDMCAPAGGNLDRHYNYVPGESKKAGDHFTYLPFWCCLIKKAVIDTVGLLDEDYGAGFWDDVDYNFRAKKAGFKLGIVELPEVKHAYHQTFLKSGINIQKQYQTNRAVFLSKWGIV